VDLDLHGSVGRRLLPDAVVVQDDRNLVMNGPPPGALDRTHDLDAAYLEVARNRPLGLGRYMLLRPRDDVPYWTYQAVVHDLALEQTCRPGDVRRSLLSISQDAVKRGLTHLALEPLGMWGANGLGMVEFVEALDASVLEMAIGLTQSVRLTVLLEELPLLEEMSLQLRSRLLRRASRSLRTADGDAAVVEVRREGFRLCFRFVPGSLSGYQVTRVADVA
jgi:hypothetical protein